MAKSPAKEVLTRRHKSIASGILLGTLQPGVPNRRTGRPSVYRGHTFWGIRGGVVVSGSEGVSHQDQRLAGTQGC